MIVKQIVDFTTIYFIHRNSHWKVSFIFLPIPYPFIKQVLDSHLLQTLHSVSFSWTCLSISKNGDSSRIEYQI